MARINKTLLSRLFYEPDPQPQNEEVILYYRELHSRIFPNSNDFIEFLKAQNIDRQYESAERIVHRLCYHANFPPSYYALLDIICVENYQKKEISYMDNYIPRDHFIHIVYLYLLGIYVFFYNSELYYRIISSNKFERRGLAFGNITRDCIKDFISEWKYFCLYHDIGYSAEILGNSKKYPNRKKVQTELKCDPGGFKTSLGKNAILKQHTYFGAFEIISKLLFTKLVISNSDEKIYPEHKIFRSFQEKSLKEYCTTTKVTSAILFKEISGTFLSGIQLEKIYSNHCLKKILPSIGLDNIIIIGFKKDTGHLAFITYLVDSTRKFIYSEDLETNAEFKTLLTNPEFITFDDYFPKSFELIYVLKNCNYEKRISTVVDIEIFNEVYNQAERLFEDEYKGITDETHFIDFSYIIYHWYFTNVKKDLDNTKLETYLDLQKFSFSAKSQEEITNDLLKRSNHIYERIITSLDKYESLLVERCNELLQKKISEKFTKSPESTSPNEMLSNNIKQYFDAASTVINSETIKDIFLDDLHYELLSRIEEEAALLQLFSHVFVQLKCTLDKSDVWFEYNYLTGDILVPAFLENRIQQKVRDKMSIPDLETFYQEYRLEFGNTVDHGIVSAQYASSVFSCYRDALLKVNNEREAMLLSILLDIPNEIKESYVRYIGNYDHVFTNVLFAVFVHNLYPSQFKKSSKGAEYKTRISDPFTYLSLLCDALQEWNRPRSLHPSFFSSRSLSGASEEYDIDVTDNCIYLSDIGAETNQWIANNISKLNTYLANIKVFLRQKHY